MKAKVAIYALAPPGWGGSFQYASSILGAVSRLDGEQYDVRAWYIDPAWKKLLSDKQIPAVAVSLGLGDFLYRGVSYGFALLGLLRVLSPLIKQWEKVQPAARAINDWDPDICINLQQSSLPLSNHVRQIAPIHDLMHLYERGFPEVGNSAEWAARQYLYTNLVRRCRMILVDSELGQRHVCESYGVSSDGVFVLPFVAPDTLLDANPRYPASLPPAIDKDGDGFLFYPAQFWQHKNHVGLLEAVARLRDLNIRCIFTGTTDKNGYSSAKAAIARLGMTDRAHVLGYVDDEELAWLYRHARLMVMPTFFGPTNIPPLEAMSLGCPVAISGIYGMPEQLGDAALYFDPRSAESIAHTIEMLWRDAALREKLRQAGAARIARWNARTFEDAVLKMLRAI